MRDLKVFFFWGVHVDLRYIFIARMILFKFEL